MREKTYGGRLGLGPTRSWQDMAGPKLGSNEGRGLGGRKGKTPDRGTNSPPTMGMDQALAKGKKFNEEIQLWPPQVNIPRYKKVF